MRAVYVIMAIACVYAWGLALDSVSFGMMGAVVAVNTDDDDDDDAEEVVPQKVYKKKSKPVQEPYAQRVPDTYSHREPCEGDAEAWNCGGARKGYLEL